MNIFLISILIILGGLGICYLSKSMTGSMINIFYYVGIIVAVIGLILLLFPVVSWIYHQLIIIFGI